MLLREVFFSRLVGRKVIAASGRQIGTVRDLVATSADGLPMIVGICTDGAGYLPLASFARGLSARELFVCTAEKATFDTDRWCVVKRLLDRQVIDRRDKRVYRISDLVLAVCGKGDVEEKAFLVGADIGIRGICRRLGAEWLTAWRENRLLGYRRLAMVEEAGRVPDLHFDRYDEVTARDVTEICRKLGRGDTLRFLEQLAYSLIVRDRTRAQAVENMSPVADLPVGLRRIVCDAIERKRRSVRGGTSCEQG